jgi:GTP-binding protein
VGDLFGAVDAAYASAVRDLKTPELTRILEEAVQAHQPPLVHGRRIKLRYAHQGGRNPPLIVVHGNQTEHVPAAYRRYLGQRFAGALRLRGTPVRVEFRTGANPYEGRKNRLTPRQVRKRTRLVRFVKGKR